jgi:hypothetical protein
VRSVDLSGELEAVIARADMAACLDFCHGLSEAERQELAPAVVARYREVREEKDPSRSFTFPEGHWDRMRAALVVLYATATFKEISRLDVGSSVIDPMYQVLSARRPAWLEQWVDWTLTHGNLYATRWTVVRRLILDGLCSRPDSDAYYLGLLCHPNPRQLLERDSDLLHNDVWRLFEIEGRADASLSQRDKYSRTENQWAPLLRELGENGRLDRRRLLSASLGALLRGFKPFQASWFSRFHESLNPSKEERAALAPQYLQLLASPVPASVSLALKAVQTLEQAGHLDENQALEAVPAALYSRAGSTAETALKLLESIVKRRPALRERAAELAVSALEHSSVTVQKKAWAFVETYGDPARLADRHRMAARLVAPSLRKSLLHTEAASSPEPAQSAPDSRVHSIPTKWLRRAGIHADGSLEPLDLRGPGIPRLLPANIIQPIRSLEELVPVLLRLFETEEPIDDVERALDGISRLCSDRPADFDRLVSPLRKRAQLITKRWARTPASLLARLSLAWTDQLDWTARLEGDDAEAFLTKRVKAIAVRVCKRVPRQLLSTPTHAAGWIDPRIFEKRLKIARETDSFDLELGKLRTGTEVPAWLKKPLYEAPMIRWAATIVPSQRDAWFKTGAAVILANIDWWQAEWGNKAYLEPLFEADTPLGDAGMQLLILGLSAKENGEGTLATDALNGVIGDGRLEPASFAEALLKAMPVEPVAAKKITLSRSALSERLAQASASRGLGLKLPRLAKRLAHASQESTLSARTIQQALERVLAVRPCKPLQQLFEDLTAEYSGSHLGVDQMRLRLDRAERWAKSGK